MSDPAYFRQFETVRFDRRDGIVQLTFHTNGDSLRWGAAPVRDMLGAFAAVANDPDNRVVILTGAGAEFNGPKGSPESFPRSTPRGWESAHWNVRKLLANLLDIEAPVIAALNGPVWRHAETPLLSDIVIASETTIFQDSGHFINGLVPSDGMHLVMPLIMGVNRARYFMLTGQEIDARQALEIGMVNEVLPADRVVPRAWELATAIARQSPLVTKLTRVAFTHTIKQLLVANHGYGLLLEGLAVLDDSTTRSDGYELPAR